ncbi:AbrB/MazE/SpoVT family DNA-binding domain-containing protein [Sphingomonas carotinifaciens]|uniref:AbrB/MazE/SpoVT family DNA-binding domain-containing protein n=1 Tax=Sphingomonas carotinifaciens TaxID=1166323 RepID=UPI000DD96114|nr:AbrB/MazE/SpoVT family DNA-binding domain-containing protein [Sphingomonas carotinifaciens]
MTYHAKVTPGGKVVIPAELRRDLGIRDGDSLMFEKDRNGGLSVKTFEQVVREEQRRFRAAVGPDYSVKQFLADRGSDWPAD